jgi:hypothetical protein
MRAVRAKLGFLAVFAVIASSALWAEDTTTQTLNSGEESQELRIEMREDVRVSDELAEHFGPLLAAFQRAPGDPFLFQVEAWEEKLAQRSQEFFRTRLSKASSDARRQFETALRNRFARSLAATPEDVQSLRKLRKKTYSLRDPSADAAPMTREEEVSIRLEKRMKRSLARNLLSLLDGENRRRSESNPLLREQIARDFMAQSLNPLADYQDPKHEPLIFHSLDVFKSTEEMAKKRPFETFNLEAVAALKAGKSPLPAAKDAIEKSVLDVAGGQALQALNEIRSTRKLKPVSLTALEKATLLLARHGSLDWETTKAFLEVVRGGNKADEKLPRSLRRLMAYSLSHADGNDEEVLSALANVGRDPDYYTINGEKLLLSREAIKRVSYQRADEETLLRFKREFLRGTLEEPATSLRLIQEAFVREGRRTDFPKFYLSLSAYLRDRILYDIRYEDPNLGSARLLTALQNASPEHFDEMARPAFQEAALRFFAELPQNAELPLKRGLSILERLAKALPVTAPDLAYPAPAMRKLPDWEEASHLLSAPYFQKYLERANPDLAAHFGEGFHRDPFEGGELSLEEARARVKAEPHLLDDPVRAEKYLELAQEAGHWREPQGADRLAAVQDLALRRVAFPTHPELAHESERLWRETGAKLLSEVSNALYADDNIDRSAAAELLVHESSEEGFFKRAPLKNRALTLERENFLRGHRQQNRIVWNTLEVARKAVPFKDFCWLKLKEISKRLRRI